MAVDRKQMMNAMAVFKDPKQMRFKYGILIHPDQIEKAQKMLEFYQKASEQELKKTDPQQAAKWPYALTEEQRYDKLMFQITLTMTQTVLWNHIKKYLIAHQDERKTNATAIQKALNDMEGFLQLNIYRGAYEENKDFLDGKNIPTLMKLFTISYNKYLNQIQIRTSQESSLP